MFLSFGKKSLTSKKNGAPVESPQGTSSPETSSSFTNHKSVSSRSTVQTTAGPLLSSSRFNSVLDPSTYANVNSPGFTSRVINSASNGSTSLLDERATHQNKYFSVGLFPRVQLGQSILPTLSPKNSQKVGRTPVRVRIASPSLTGHRRHSICGLTSDTSTGKRETLKRSPSAGQNSGTELFSTNLSGNAPSSAENTQESSRKRMFSECHDPCDEAKKRRRKAEMPIPNPNSDMYRYRHVRVPAISSYASPPDVPSQGKRAREKGSPEEQKRQRRKICNLNNAIFSSLSSSRNLLERLTAEKRKSADLSRPGSPSITLTRKKIEENTTRNDVKAIQSNMDFASHRSKSLLNVSPQDKTPISSRIISQKIDYPMKESPEKPRDKSQDTLKCDYTTKLFRKDVPSHSPRTPTSRPQKQSLWIQAPEVDEFTCSLLSGDSRVDRPERLKSLLACVSGKESANLEDNALPIVSISSRTSKEEVKVFQPRISSPSSSSSKSLSPSGGNISSALTVTVSSTCTIMTSATVTSVNGVPSSESGSSPPLRPISVLSATPICLPNSPSTSTVIASVSNATTKISGETNQKHSTAVDNLDIVTSAGPVASFPSLPSVTQPAIKFSTTPCSLDPESLSKGSMMNQDDTAKVHRSGSSKQECNSFLVKSPSNSSVITSGTSSAPISQEPKSAFHSVTSSNSEPNVAPKAFQFSTKSQPLGTTVITPASVSQSTANSANPIGTEHSSSAPASSSFGTKPFSFGSSGKVASEVSNSGHQLPNTSFSMPNKGNDSFVLPKSSFDFGQSVGKDSEVPMLAQHSFSFGPSVHKDKEPVVLPKSTFTFGSNGVKNSTSTESEPSFQSRTGASGPQMSQNTFQFGSNVKNSSVSTEAPKLTGSSATSSNISSESPKTNFKFGSNTTKPTEIPKPGFQFVSGNQPVDSTKSTFQFGSSCYGASNPTAIFQVTSGTKSSGLQKPALLFGSTSNEVGTISQQSASHNSSVKAPSNSAFKFGSDADASTTPKHSFHFGSNVNGSSDIGKSPFQFSSGMDKPTESSKSSFQFSNNLVVPNFGSSSQNPTFSEGASKTDKFACASSNKLVTPGTFSFGSSGNIATCSVPTPGAMFGSGTTSSASGNQTIPAPGAIFGSGMTSSVSGIQTHSSTDPKSGGFGTTPTFGGASTFSFNSSTAVNSANTFQFGGTPQSGNAGPFPFGQDQAPGAFNFSATVTAVPSMSTSAPGLFSIGSGPSTTQRRTTTARRRR